MRNSVTLFVTDFTSFDNYSPLNGQEVVFVNNIKVSMAYIFGDHEINQMYCCVLYIFV